MKESKGFQFKIRRFPRVKTLLYYRPVNFMGQRNRISNLSLGGARIYSDKHLKIGKRIEIEIFLPNKRSLVAKTRVVWIKTLTPGPSTLYDMGLEFTSLPPGAMNELKTVLDKSYIN